VLERGDVANSWRTERWDSLRLLTPNWQSRLPGYGYEGNDPDNFRTMPETVAFIARYARVIDAPVQTHTIVTSLSATDDGYRIATDARDYYCRSVVISTGACNIAHLPACAAGLPPSIQSLTPMQYRRPDQLEPGGVLVVGASATGVQLADEIHRSGRPVTLAVGEHIRAPRIYRGKDIQWWMDQTGVHHERYDQVDDITRARNVPSMQLVGSPERRSLDLNALGAIGVKLVGRLAGIADGKAQFSGALGNQCALSDLKMNRLLDGIDTWASANGLDGEIDAPVRFPPTQVEAAPPLSLDLNGGAIKTILWATGYRPDYSWLHVPVLNRKGHIRHDGGVVATPGLYLMGMPFLRRRKSTLIDGAGDDARELVAHLASYLDDRTAKPQIAGH
jgi:putative flavoprotein involved in K+ transport